MGWLRKQFEKKKNEIKQDFAARAQIRKKERAEYYRAKEKQALREADARAKIEADARIKKYKERQKNPGYTFKGFAGPTQKRPSAALGVADYLTGNTGGKKKKKGKDPLLGDLF